MKTPIVLADSAEPLRARAPRQPGRSQLGEWGALALVFAVALGVRLVRLSDPPLDFHPTRQYRSALLARHLYLESLPGVAKWRRDMARANAPPLYEPPFLERAAALAYRLRGREDLRIPRLFSSFAWLAAGAWVYGLARRVGGTPAALVSAAFFLLCPFAVEASRSFQPDPVMVMLLAATAAALMRYGDHPQLGVLLPAALAGGLAVLAKPMAIFQVFGGFLAVWLLRRRELGSRWLVHAVVFGLGVALPVAPYYVSQWLEGGSAGWIARQSFLPQLFLTRDFWVGWCGQIWKTCGLVAPAAAAIGIGVARDRLAKALFAGMAAGYVAFVLVFNYQGSTHDYYHLQILPLVAVGLAPLVERGVAILHRGSPSPRAALAVAGAILVAACLDAALAGRSRLRSHHFEEEVRMYQEIGEKVGHGRSNVLLADYYAYPLMYHGELGGSGWPRYYDFHLTELMGGSRRSPSDMLRSLIDGQKPRFFVVTVPGDLVAQPDLGSLLENGYARHATGAGYVIYDLARPAGASR